MEVRKSRNPHTPRRGLQKTETLKSIFQDDSKTQFLEWLRKGERRLGAGGNPQKIQDIPNPHLSIQDVDREHYFGSKSAAAPELFKFTISLPSLLFSPTRFEQELAGHKMTTEAFDLHDREHYYSTKNSQDTK
jgi:hypothetical protein